MLRKFLGEPLVHFVLLACVILSVYSLIAERERDSVEELIVSAPKIEQLAAIFAQTRQRPATDEELKGLIDDYVKDEIYAREAIKLGLDQDDTVIRRRLRQKMEFMADDAADQLFPSDIELAAYLKEHREDFATDPMASFEQVFFNAELRGEQTEQDARKALEILRKGQATDASALGDATMLPAELPLSTKTALAQTFGTAFAEAVVEQPPKQWAGPLSSEFGLHLVRISDQMPGRVPELSEVADDVRRNWKNAKRRELEAKRLAELLRKYTVTIETAEQGSPL